MKTNTISFKDWSTLFTDVFGDNGKIALCYYLASIYRKQIIKEFGFFPLLYTYGPPASGKSALGFHLIDLLNNNNPGLVPTYSVSAQRLREILGLNNYRGILYLDEYDNNHSEAKNQLMISAYNIHFASKICGDESTANEVKSIVKKSIYFCGQQPLENESLALRSIMLNMAENVQSQNREAYIKLREIPSADLLRMKSRIISPFKGGFNSVKIEPYFKEVSKQIERKLEVNVSARVICHYAILLSIYNFVSLRNYVPFCHAQMLEVVVDKITEQAKAISNLN